MSVRYLVEFDQLDPSDRAECLVSALTRFVDLRPVPIPSSPTASQNERRSPSPASPVVSASRSTSSSVSVSTSASTSTLCPTLSPFPSSLDSLATSFDDATEFETEPKTGPVSLTDDFPSFLVDQIFLLYSPLDSFLSRPVPRLDGPSITLLASEHFKRSVMVRLCKGEEDAWELVQPTIKRLAKRPSPATLDAPSISESEPRQSSSRPETCTSRDHTFLFLALELFHLCIPSKGHLRNVPPRHDARYGWTSFSVGQEVACRHDCTPTKHVTQLCSVLDPVFSVLATATDTALFNDLLASPLRRVLKDEASKARYGNGPVIRAEMTQSWTVARRMYTFFDATGLQDSVCDLVEGCLVLYERYSKSSAPLFVTKLVSVSKEGEETRVSVDQVVEQVDLVSLTERCMTVVPAMKCGTGTASALPTYNDQLVKVGSLTDGTRWVIFRILPAGPDSAKPQVVLSPTIDPLKAEGRDSLFYSVTAALFACAFANQVYGRPKASCSPEETPSSIVSFPAPAPSKEECGRVFKKIRKVSFRSWKEDPSDDGTGDTPVFTRLRPPYNRSAYLNEEPREVPLPASPTPSEVDDSESQDDEWLDLDDRLPGPELCLDLERFLGSGNLGRVYRLPAPFDDLVVKLADLTCRRGQSKMRNEAYAYSRLHGIEALRHLLPEFYGVFQNDEGRCALLLSYEGEEATGDYSWRDLTDDQTEDVAKQVEVLHAVGWNHHSIKPSNIVLGPSGSLRIVDFQRAIPDCTCKLSHVQDRANKLGDPVWARHLGELRRTKGKGHVEVEGKQGEEAGGKVEEESRGWSKCDEMAEVHYEVQRRREFKVAQAEAARQAEKQKAEKEAREAQIRRDLHRLAPANGIVSTCSV